MKRPGWGGGWAALALAAMGCAGEANESPCADLDSVLTASSFIVVRHPSPGESSKSPLHVTGCSRTFESNVVWELHGRDGRVVASGFTTGGGVDGPAPFEVSAEFTVPEAEVGSLVVFMPDESEGEGLPPPRTEFQVVLAPGT